MFSVGLVERPFNAVPSNLLDLLDGMVGWGQDACDDAADYEYYEVTNTNDSGAGSLRAAWTTVGGRWIRFTVSGSWTLGSSMSTVGRKVVDARGQSVVIQTSTTHDGMLMENGSDVIFCNVDFYGQDAAWDADGDTADLTKARVFTDIYFKNCRFRQADDGAFDIPTGYGDSRRITFDRCRFEEIWQAQLLYGDEITVYHCAYRKVRRRTPTVHDAGNRAHKVNCITYDWNNPNVLAAQDGAELLDDNNFYEPVSETDVGDTTGAGKIEFINSVSMSGTPVYVGSSAIDSTFKTASQANAPATTIPAGGTTDRWGMFFQLETEAGTLNLLRGVWRVSSPTGTGSTIDLASHRPTVQAGDLCIISALAESAAATPSAVTPSGFTSLATANGGAAPGLRASIFAKIIDGTETTVSIASGTTYNGFVVNYYRGNRAIASFGTAQSVNTDQTGGDPVSQTITASGGTKPVLVLAGMYNLQADNNINPRTASPFMRERNQGNHNFLLDFNYNYIFDPVNHSVDMDDEGGRQIMLSCYLNLS